MPNVSGEHLEKVGKRKKKEEEVESNNHISNGTAMTNVFRSVLGFTIKVYNTNGLYNNHKTRARVTSHCHIALSHRIAEIVQPYTISY